MNTPYVEFSKANMNPIMAKKFIPAGSVIRYINDNTDPSNIKTYIFYQRNAATPPSVPIVPPDWSTYEATFDHDTTLKFRTQGDVYGILTNSYEFYFKVN